MNNPAAHQAVLLIQAEPLDWINNALPPRFGDIQRVETIKLRPWSQVYRVVAQREIGYFKICGNEGEIYRDIRLASLADAPEAFESTLESALERTLKSWTEQADSTASGSQRNTMLGFDQDVPVGLAALYQDPNRVDVAYLIQVWVHPDHRGTGLATTLISQLFSWAKDCGYRQISTEVTVENARAMKFYQKLGFQRTDATRILSSSSAQKEVQALEKHLQEGAA